jgi:hypothetical protein
MQVPQQGTNGEPGERSKMPAVFVKTLLESVGATISITDPVDLLGIVNQSRPPATALALGRGLLLTGD